MICSITAKFRCDGCNATIEWLLDPAEKAPESIASYADELLADSISYSVQSGYHLCNTCTRHVDDYVDDDTRDATLEEINAALDEAYAEAAE